MSGSTSHYGLSRVGPGDHLSDDSYKYCDVDRERIDQLIYQGVTGHKHNADTGAGTNPTQGLNLTLDTTQGSVPAGTRVYYKYTLVDVLGNETAASPESWIETSQPFASPNAPTLTAQPGEGTLLPGNYYYVVTVYEDANSQETLALHPNWITLRAAGGITLTMPTLPTGATGFNVYRKAPGDFSYFYLTSTTSTSIEDTGLAASSTRVVPQTNTTNASNAVTISFPGATPTVPSGYSWKLYRTYAAGNYQNSLVHHIVEETSSGSGIISPSFDDMGTATLTGQPPTQTYSVDSPDRVNLTGMVEVQGHLPPGGVKVFPWTHTFFLPGLLVSYDPSIPVPGLGKFVIPFEVAHLGALALWLEEPTADTVILNMLVYRQNQATPDYLGNWYNGLITLNPGEFWTHASATDATFENFSVAQGDIVSLQVIQGDDAAATPMASDLSLTIGGWAIFSDTSDADFPAWIPV